MGRTRAATFTRRGFLRTTGMGLAAVGLPLGGRAESDTPPTKPNFVLVFTDDQGYQDVGCFGSPRIRTPRLDALAREGMRFTSFYAQTVCGPSRAALMTGCYPLRVAKKGNRVEVHPRLHAREITLAEVLKGAGYATAAFGKWDLAGHTQNRFEPELMPNKQGFDTFFGTPTSNDRLVNLYRNDQLVEKSADMNQLTRRYTDEAVAFLRAHKDKPLFLYLAHTMPHTRLGASERFRGRSRRGLYGDVIEEIDWNVGRILDAIKELRLERRTYVIFTSDNGPWAIKGEHGGSAAPLRGAKTSTWEGGLRVPCIMWAPGRIARRGCRARRGGRAPAEAGRAGAGGHRGLQPRRAQRPLLRRGPPSPGHPQGMAGRRIVRAAKKGSPRPAGRGRISAEPVTADRPAAKASPFGASPASLSRGRRRRVRKLDGRAAPDGETSRSVPRRRWR